MLESLNPLILLMPAPQWLVAQSVATKSIYQQHRERKLYLRIARRVLGKLSIQIHPA